MFGEACKGGILLFFALRGNTTAGSTSVGRGMRDPFLQRNRRGMRGRRLSYRGISEAGSDQSFWDVAEQLTHRKRGGKTKLNVPERVTG